ncbi:MAG TPA: serine/threonine-protein kinase [Polyangiaceae bacterium]
MSEAKNKPTEGATPSSGEHRVTGPRLANATEGGVVPGATPVPNDATRLRVVTISPGGHSFPDVEAPSRDRRDPYVGAIIDGRYKVETVLGEGGMGVVYRCSHTIIGKKLALKVLRADLARDGEVTERFLNEARSASAIGNPHIIDISDFGQLPDGSTYFVMEFLTGQALTGAIQGGPMPEARLLSVSRQLGEALGAAHAAGIVHRDLKPDNIFLIERGAEKDFVKILDFGIAKVSTSAGKLTRAGAVFGTPHYMSPEQAAGTDVDLRGDVYSLGVILYELATGRVPFDADNFMGVLTQHMYKAPPPLRDVAPKTSEISAGLEAVIVKCLAKRPEHRYQSMAELVVDLDRLRAGAAPSAARGRHEDFTAPGGYFDDLTVPRRRPSTALVAAGLLLLAGLAFGVALLLRQKPSQAPLPEVATKAPESKPEPPAAPPGPEAKPGPALRQVLVATEPISARIFKGSEDLGVSPVSVDVPEGQSVELSIKADGFRDMRVVVDGTETRQSIRLERTATARPKTGKAPVPTAKPTARPQPGKRPSMGGGEIIDPWGK